MTVAQRNISRKESECWLHEDGEKQRCSEAKKEEEEIDERLKQRKLAIEEMALKLEASITEVETSLVMIRDWKTRGNKVKQEGST
ncbi:unnamed protein product [Arabis nemorensis]|uniref:Uncharacterized protein n=1 Tax=Arabis nemorensis TaxID=586526 RepID=A0A565BHY2_9BRAS|nr:unnamed protein product [Arabis nemorensis]